MKLRIQSPSRLHFGLFGWGPHALRQFGGFGLMIDAPSLDISAQVAPHDTIDGPFAAIAHPEKIRELIQQSRAFLAQKGVELPPLHLYVHHAPPQHQGLGSGTQRAMTIAKIASDLVGFQCRSSQELARLVNRFPRSGVGVNGFQLGGLIVDGGHAARLQDHREPAPLISRLAWPEAWRVILVMPAEPEGISGSIEAHTFGNLPAPDRQSLAEMSQTVLTGFLPAVAASEFDQTMSTLESAQRIVGNWFAPAQGGCLYGSPSRDRLVQLMKQSGLRGVGQSSWGPSLFGFCRQDEIVPITDALSGNFSQMDNQPVLIQTRACQAGHQCFVE